MFFQRKTSISPLELIEARLAVIESRVSRIERRWSVADKVSLDQALESLSRAVRDEAEAKRSQAG
jgi:hypothetical protein